MKKSLVSIIILALFLPLFVGAQGENSLQTRPAEKVTPAREKRIDSTDRMVNKRAVTRAERVKNYVDQVVARLNRVLNRVADLLSRVEKHIIRLAERGINVDEARAKYALAVDAVARARAAIAALPGKLAALEQENLTRAAAQSVREEVRKATEAVRAAHQSVVEVIGSLRPGANTPATTSPTSNNTN